MKKFLISLFALFAVFAITSCEMTYDKDYPEYIVYYTCWGDNSEWFEHSDTSKTLMTKNLSTGKYAIDIETTKKNQRFEITAGAGYSLEYCYFNKNNSTYSQDEANHSLFPKTADNGYGSLQTVLPTPGKYLIEFDPVTKLYTVTAK